MDTMQHWALWRLLIIALITLPFLIAVVIAGSRQRHVDGASAGAGHDDTNAFSPTVGPDAWRKESNGPLAVRTRNNAAVVGQRAA